MSTNHSLQQLSLRHSNDRRALAGFLRRPGRPAAADGRSRSNDETAAGRQSFSWPPRLRIKVSTDAIAPGAIRGRAPG